MDIAGKYIGHVQDKVKSNPEGAWKEMVFGYNAFHKKTKYFPKKYISKGYAKLEEMMMRVVATSLRDSEKYVWTSIYVPSEIIAACGLQSLSIEVISAYMSHGYRLEKPLIDRAEAAGIAPTLCSFHKSFLGAAEADLIPFPTFCVSSSLACDGNLATMEYASSLYGIPFYFIDVPQEDDDESVKYLADQLRELAENIEKYTGNKFSMEEFEAQVKRTRETNREMLKFYELAADHYYPGELIHKMYMMMASNITMGSQEFLDLIKFMNSEIEDAPPFEGKKITWVHVLPFYHGLLKEIFDCSQEYQVMVSDIAVDYIDEFDTEDPFEFTALRMIHHAFNGSMKNKTDVLDEIMKRYQPDGVINFCHWGCKQAFGGSAYLKDYMKEKNIPFLNLDGDGIDERNSHDGQIKTRIEAFLEILGREDEK